MTKYEASGAHTNQGSDDDDLQCPSRARAAASPDDVLLPMSRDVSAPRITHETGGEVIEAKNIESMHSASLTPAFSS